jgi:PAS domain S-box-containing protein
VPTPLYLSEPDGTIIDANPAMVELLGYPDRDSLLALNAFDLYIDRESRSELMERIEREDLIRDYEVQLRRRDGKPIWVLDHSKAVRDRRGRVQFYEGSLEDITERKRAEQELQSTNEKLRALIEHSPIGIISLDLEGKVISWNRAAERIFGWTEAEVLGQPLPIVPDEKREEFQRLFERATRGELLEEVELRRLRRDGSAVHISLSARPLRDASGSVIGTISVVVDLTERMLAEETRRRLAEILEATPDLVGVSTIDGACIYLNPAGRKMLGINADDDGPYGPLWKYQPEPDQTKLREEAIPTAIRHGTWSGEIVLKSWRGREIPTSFVVIAHRTPNGEVDYVSTVARDLSEQKMLEERLREAQTMDAIGRLAGGIAHDFNNLLTAVIGHADLLLNYIEDEQARADVREIKVAGERAAALTSHLLAFSRRQVTQPRLLDLNSVVAGLEPRLRQMAGRDIELVSACEDGPGLVKADPIQIEKVVGILAQNSCEAMPDGGRLTLRISWIDLAPEEARKLGLPRAGLHAVLSVADTGIGMDEETKARIFEPFFSTKKEVKGIGLGLATAYGIVKQSGGGIYVDSEPGRGTTVNIYLPALAKEIGVARDPVKGAAAPGTCRTVLLVEDEPAVLGVAARVLRTLGLTVLEAQDGVEALEVMEAHPDPIDLLITDVVMPKLGGPELAERIQRSNPGTCVIFMSGYSDNRSVREMMADQSVYFIQKPFTPSMLTGMVRRVLGQAPPGPIEQHA